MTETTDLQRLIVSLEANLKKYEKEMARAIGVSTNATRKVERDFDLMNNNVGAGFKKMAATAAGFLSVAFMLRFAKEALAFADELGETSAALGVTSEKLQGLRFAAKLSGIEAGDLDKILFKLARQASGADTDVDDFARALGKLGISIASLRGKKPDEVLDLIADRLTNIKDPLQRAGIAADLAGEKLGIKLLKMTNAGSAGLAAFALQAKQAGLILSEDTIAKADKASNEFDTMGVAMRSAGINISVGLLPSLIKLRELMTDPSFQTGVKDIAEKFGNLIQWMVNNSGTITTVVAALAGMKVGAVFGPGGAIVGGAVAAIAAMKAMESELDSINKKIRGLDLARFGMKVFDSPLIPDNIKENLARKALSTELQRDQLMKRRAVLLEEIAKKEQEVAASAAASAASEKERALKLDVGKTEFIDPDVTKAIEDAAFKARLARGEFSLLADGFPELVHGFKLSTGAIDLFRGSIESLPPQLQRLNEQMRATNKAKGLEKGAEDFGKAFGRAFEDAILRAKDFQDVLKALGDELARIMLRLLITNQLERTLKGAFSGFFGGLFGGASPVSASVAPTGMPVAPSNVRARGGGGSANITNYYSIDARGADVAAVARIERGLDEHTRNFSRNVGAVQRVRQVRNVRY